MAYQRHSPGSGVVFLVAMALLLILFQFASPAKAEWGERMEVSFCFSFLKREYDKLFCSLVSFIVEDCSCHENITQVFKLFGFFHIPIILFRLFL